ncbi:MAG TPA: hypothetical protein VGE96_04705 [Steroidobacteraceae bacterium]
MRSLTLLSALALVPAAIAAPGSTSPYATDLQTSHVEDATSRGIGEVNMIACVMSALRPDALVNQGDYVALVDKNKCDSEKRSSSGNSGSNSDSAQGAPAYITAVVNSARASNNDPMIVKTWLDIEEEGAHQQIFVHISASQAPSESNAYGVFRLDYCGKLEGMSGCPSRGYLEGTSTGLDFYQVDDNGQDSQTTALRLTSAAGASGAGRLQQDAPFEHNAFSFAYDAGLYRRADDNDDQCFSRDASDVDTGLSVWRYGLYDAVTGARVTRNSGFPIEFTAAGQRYQGFLGYYGLSLPGEAMDALANGSTVDKVDYSSGDSPTRTSYTVLKAPGKLTKYTRKTRTLRAMDKIKFTTFVDMNAGGFFAGAEPNMQYELYWDDASGSFIATGKMSCGENGCQTEDLSSPQTVSIAYWATRGGVQGYSQSLGGEVFINLQGATGAIDSSAVEVIYRTQDLVYPGNLPATLFCVQNCPTEASLQSYFAPGSADASPYVASSFNNWQPTPAASVVTYGTDVASATLRDGVNGVVAFTDAEALRQRPSYQFGVRTGRLFTNLADAECALGSQTYCDWKVNDVEVYYQWETGANPFNQFAAVKDSGGNFVAFDAPLQLTYTVPMGARYGQYAGKSIVLQYGGFGDLWGIPGYCVSRLTNAQMTCNSEEARYVPAFVIPYDATAGAVSDGTTTYLVKWLDREIRFAQKPLSACSAAGLTVPNDVTLPTASVLKDTTDSSSDVYIGAKPVVTAAPRVIHGDVKY